LLTISFAIIIPFLAAILIPFIYKRVPQINIGWFVIVVPIILFAGLARYIPAVATGEKYIKTISWIPSAGINFTTHLDGLSMIFGLLITGVGSLVILYSIYYLSNREALGHFYVYLLLFMGSMLGVVFSDNMIVLYVFWELTSISSFLLIAFWSHRKQSRYGAQKSLLITVSGGLAMLVGFIMIYTMTGSFSISENIDLIRDFSGSALFLPAMILVLLGAFTKSAQFPFHIWLPDAMEAPTPVSAYLHSATMVKAGIYLVARFTPIFGGEAVWFYVVSGVGIFTLFWGSFNAVRQTDLKALLAYSTISQLGLIMSLFGLGSAALNVDYRLDSVIYTQATFAALFHLVNHSTFKGALFMVIGIIDHNVGTRDIRRLGGLMAFMPVTFTIALIGSFSMAGLPPFNGFLSKELFFESVLNVRNLEFFSIGTWGLLFPIIAWVASVLTFVYSMIIVFQTFFGKHQPEKLDRKAHEAPIGMLIAPSILALLVVSIFFFPNVIGKYLLQPAMAAIYPMLSKNEDLTPHISAWHGFNDALIMTIGVIIVGAILYIFVRQWHFVYTLFPADWSLDHLYNNTLSKMESGATLLTDRYMNGILRNYLVYIFTFFLLIVGGTFFVTGSYSFDLSNDAPILLNEYILVFIMMAAAIAILFAKSRLTSILLNGVLGYSIALFFVFFRAPDLALTQIVVETVTTALFLLCFHFLPEWKREKSTRPSKVFNGIIAISAGILVTVIALAVQGNKMFDSISVYFEENAYDLAGGKNIVNTILADFRAFDTMLEVVVLFIAGIGVYTLIKLKARKEGPDVEDK